MGLFVFKSRFPQSPGSASKKGQKEWFSFKNGDKEFRDIYSDGVFTRLSARDAEKFPEIHFFCENCKKVLANEDDFL